MYLARLADTLADANVVVHSQVIEAAEPAAKVILDTARHEHVDVIALGTHTKAGVSRLVLGSVSEEVLERSRRPVLLIHRDAAGNPTQARRELSTSGFTLDTGASPRKTLATF